MLNSNGKHYRMHSFLLNLVVDKLKLIKVSACPLLMIFKTMENMVKYNKLPNSKSRMGSLLT